MPQELGSPGWMIWGSGAADPQALYSSSVDGSRWFSMQMSSVDCFRQPYPNRTGEAEASLECMARSKIAMTAQ